MHVHERERERGAHQLYSMHVPSLLVSVPEKVQDEREGGCGECEGVHEGGRMCVTMPVSGLPALVSLNPHFRLLR